MNEKALRVLEYNKIIARLTDYASSSMGKALCRELTPMTDLAQINSAQHETSAALTRLFKYGSLPFYGIRDIRTSIKRLEIGSALSAQELLHICSLLENAKRIKAYSRSQRDEEEGDCLDPLFEAIEPLTPLAAEIRRCIVSEEDLADDASPALRQIRRNMKNANDKIHSQLNAMVNSASTRTYLQDAVITMRNGRYCLPVKAEHRSSVPGMIHDQSGSGSTLFIEPMSVVKLNNDIRELELKEEEEIEKILADLSQQAAGYKDVLAENLNVLTRLDFIFAKAGYARDYNGTAPIFNTQGRINIRQGRHPLLDPKKVVPINVRLGDRFDQLIITGPNTGGKTVSLKTVGLFTLMGQAGLHIPALDRSKLAVFEEVYGDIGDEQSIEQSLSTFSSHMTNIVNILEHADSHSLVLFDELCAGTDPTEGAALAIAILTFLHNMQVRTMATTHYSELKVYALGTPGVENACCEFNVETLCPTYRLLIGVPGKSNAFAISSRLGLPGYIIEDARARLSSQQESFEDLISDLESSRVTIEKEQQQIQAHREEIQRLREKLEEKHDKIANRRDAILRQANEEARKILSEAKSYADTTIRNFQKYGAAGANSKQMEQERSALREKLSAVEKNLAYKTEAPRKKQADASDFEVGALVKVLTLGLNGTVSTPPNQKGEVYVQMGALRSQVNIKDLEFIAKPQKEESAKRGSYNMGKSSTISSEINLIGQTVDEALPRLDKYLDDAYLAHLSQVRIVHGKGTGALKNAVHQHLRKQKYIKAFRLGAFGEGDTGVTIAEFADS